MPTIDKTIALPSDIRRAESGANMDILRAMEPGDSIALTADNCQSFRTASYRLKPKTFICRKTGPGEFRLWRAT